MKSCCEREIEMEKPTNKQTYNIKNTFEKERKEANLYIFPIIIIIVSSRS
jgi:hypothetical protein